MAVVQTLIWLMVLVAGAVAGVGAVYWYGARKDARRTGPGKTKALDMQKAGR